MTQSAPEVPASTQPESKPGFNLVRVILIVLGIAVLGGIGFGVNEFLSNQGHAHIAASGRVTWNGQPVTIGAVITQHTGDQFESAIGMLNENGEFELLSNGTPGAAPGVHKVIIASYGPGMGTTPLVPQEYLKAQTTPLSITITRDPEKNRFALVVVGEKPDNAGGGGRPPGGGGGGRGGRRPQADTAEQPVDTPEQPADPASQPGDSPAAETADPPADAPKEPADATTDQPGAETSVN